MANKFIDSFKQCLVSFKLNLKLYDSHIPEINYLIGVEEKPN
jgi:hypothetical protein